MDNTIVKVENLTKVYKLYDRPIDRLKESLHPLKKVYHRDFYALNDISFSVNKGETIGIIGKNGSGKSTLLKIISGVLTQSSGSIQINGRISALLELGAGFNPELTGIENIYLNGTIHGYTKTDMSKKIDDILDFADIGEFAKQPVKNYSSGMFVRLAFAVATSVEPEILVVDEALAVGDIFFQAKCIKKMKSIMESGCTILYVSHDLGSIKSLCNKAIYLDKGRIKAIGDSGDICDYFISEEMKNNGYFKERNENAPINSNRFDNTNSASDENIVIPIEKIETFKKRVEYFRQGEQSVKIIYSHLLDSEGNPVTTIQFGQTVSLEIFYESEKDLDELVVAVYVRDINQIDIIGTNNVYEEAPILNIKKNKIYGITFTFTSYLKSGNYYITAILADSINTTKYYDWIDNAVVFTSYDIPGKTRWAYLGPPMKVSNSVVNKLNSTIK